jgi:N-acetylglucosamine kinase-like BadF-type ATPase
MTLRHIVVDGGKSKTAAAIIDGTGRIRRLVIGPGLPMIAEPDGPESVERSLGETLGALRGGRFHTAVFGLNGVHAPSPDTDRAAGILRRLIDADRLVVASDGVLGYAGSLGTTPGVSLSVGTGSVMLAIGLDGTAHRVDGDGPLLGDHGSGYAVGLAGIRNGIRVLDGADGSSVLAEEVRREYGSIDEAVRVIYGSPAPTKLVASFSRNVERAARHGDRIAISIWRKAAGELARGVAAGARRAGLEADFPVATSGGLFEVGSLLLEPFAGELSRVAPGAVLRAGTADAIAGGAVIARSAEPVFVAVSSWSRGTPG